MTKKIAVVVEDTDANRVFFERLLTQAGFDVRGARSGSEAFAIMNAVDSIALAVVDMEIPDYNGIDLTFKMRTRFPEACIVVATMHDERSIMESAFSRGCNIFLVKPNGLMDLYKRITTVGVDTLRDNPPLVIDQYGPRPFKVAV